MLPSERLIKDEETRVYSVTYVQVPHIDILSHVCDATQLAVEKIN